MRRTLLALLLALPASGTAAAELLLTLDPAASEIRFTLAATLHTVRGSVALASGEIRIDPESGELGGRLVVDATSAETGHQGRDRDMHRKVLESERFGSFVLEPRRLEGKLDLAGTSQVVLHGDLAIHGGTHAVALPARVSIDGDRLSATATLEVPYVAWGMKNPSKLLLRVSKVVAVEITASGTLAPAGEADPAAGRRDSVRPRARPSVVQLLVDLPTNRQIRLSLPAPPYRP